MSSNERKRILVIALGGTIASTGAGGGTGVAPRLTADDLVAGVPQLRDEPFRLEGKTFRQLPSIEIGFGDILELAAEIKREVARGDVQGIVVTQGTDTMEETAFALDCLLNVDVPVVMTGAMRNPDLPGADGPGNLYAAVKVASSPEAAGLGVVVVMNDEIHAAAAVRKAHTSSTAAFTSVPGPLGWVSEGDVIITARPVRRQPIEIPAGAEQPLVPLVKLVMGDEGHLLQAVEQLDCRGLVVEAFGGGHARAVLVDTLERLARKMPVVLSSRTGAGAVLRRTYNFPGSETDLLARGLIHGGTLNAAKARVLLTLLLMAGAGRDAIEAAFAGLSAVRPGR